MTEREDGHTAMTDSERAAIRAAALREAADIARGYERRDEAMALAADDSGHPEVASAFIKYSLAARAIASAIEAAAKGGQK